MVYDVTKIGISNFSCHLCTNFERDVILINHVTFQFLNHWEFVLCEEYKEPYRDEKVGFDLFLKVMV